jgi:nicotinate phosphoribosyltransferase
LNGTEIFASGDLNEYVLDDLTSRGAPIDSFGVGTELVTSRDDPALSGIYKLVSIKRDGKIFHRVKTSEGKRTIPGDKQVYRKYSQNGEIEEDIIALEEEEPPDTTVPLMVKVIDHGKLVYDLPSIHLIQSRAKKEISTLPAKYGCLSGSVEPPVRLSSKLEALSNALWTGRGNATS